jgi:hypothetical protein
VCAPSALPSFLHVDSSHSILPSPLIRRSHGQLSIPLGRSQQCWIPRQHSEVRAVQTVCASRLTQSLFSLVLYLCLSPSLSLSHPPPSLFLLPLGTARQSSSLRAGTSSRGGATQGQTGSRLILTVNPNLAVSATHIILLILISATIIFRTYNKSLILRYNRSRIEANDVREEAEKGSP